MPEGIDWVRAWVRLEAAIQKKIDKLDYGKADQGAVNVAVAERITLEEVQELMEKYEPKQRERKPKEKT